MELSPSPQSTPLPVARANLRTRVVSPVPLGGMVKAMALPSLAGEFVISPVEGELRVRKDAELDRENIPFYNLTISARDRGVPPLSSTVSAQGPTETSKPPSCVPNSFLQEGDERNRHKCPLSETVPLLCPCRCWWACVCWTSMTTTPCSSTCQ